MADKSVTIAPDARVDARPRRFLNYLALTLAGTVLVGGMVPATASAKPTKSAERPQRVFIEGDSLTVGSAPYLQGKLRSRSRVRVDAQVGRFTHTGYARARNSGAAKKAHVLVMALGTNDGPDPRAIKNYMKRSLKIGNKNKYGKRKQQVVWVTIVRPGNYGPVNTKMKAFAKKKSRLHVVDWAKKVKRNRHLIGRDGVHASHHGYQVRANMISDKVKKLQRK